MEPVKKVEGRAYPWGAKNIDTDIIIPAHWLKTISREGLGKGAFESVRASQGNVIDAGVAAGASILIAGDNFGCGSSREHAVWALAEYGIEAIIAPSFAPIFRNNCIRNGLLPVELPEDVVRALGWVSVTIDLPQQRVSVDGNNWTFAIDAEAKAMLVEGLDAIDLTLKHREAITAFHERDRQARPWIYLEQRA